METNISKRQMSCLFDSLLDFPKTFDEASKCLHNPMPKPKVEIGSTKSKDDPFAHNYNDIIEQPNRNFVYRSHLETNFLIFSIEIFEQQGNQFILTEIVHPNNDKFHHFYKNRFFVANKCDKTESLYGV